MRRTGLLVISEEEVKQALERVSNLSDQIKSDRLRNIHKKPLEKWLKGLLEEITTDPPLPN